MNKTVLITIAVIVGLLALWLAIILLYPRGEEGVTEEPAVVETEQPAATGGVSGTVTATVQIVESLDDIPEEEESTVPAEVTITE